MCQQHVGIHSKSAADINKCGKLTTVSKGLEERSNEPPINVSTGKDVASDVIPDMKSKTNELPTKVSAFALNIVREVSELNSSDEPIQTAGRDIFLYAWPLKLTEFSK